MGRDVQVWIDVEKSSHHHLSQGEISALGQGIVEIVSQGLKPLIAHGFTKSKITSKCFRC